MLFVAFGTAIAQTSDKATQEVSTTEVAATEVAAQEAKVAQLQNQEPKVKDSTAVKSSIFKPDFLPMRKRFDREINKGIYAYKGEMMVGLTVSYGNLASDDTDYYLILDQLKLNGSIVQVNPFIGYFIADNHAVGLRFGFTSIKGSLGNASINLGESIDLGDISFGGIGLESNNYSFGLFHRAYVPIDKKGHFGLFSEFELAFQTGTQYLTITKPDTENEDGTITKGSVSTSTSDTFRAKVNFSPGLAVYVFPNVCATVSVGLGGLQYNSTKQLDNAGNTVGSRWNSQMRFRVNVADIRIGVNVHLWDKKERNK